MRDVEDELTDVNVGIELLANLARQRRFVRLSLIDFAAGKFPQAGEVHAVLAACEEKRIPVLDDRRNDNDHRAPGVRVVAGFSRPSAGYEVQERVIGHASHFGFRAVQIVAPKSISA